LRRFAADALALGDGPQETSEGALVLASGGPLAAADFIEDAGAFGVLHEDLGEGVFGVGAFGEGGEAGLVELALDAAVAALEPLGADELIEEELFDGGLGVEALGVVAGEGEELFGIFAGEEEGLGVEPELERVFGRGGLALDGAGAGGVLRVGKGSGDLS